MGAERRAEALREAAQAKHQAATKRADAALRNLIKSDEQINFRAVATAGAVSVDFLYRHPQLRQRIEHLRAQHNSVPAPAAATPQPNPDDRGVVVALTARLRDARREVAELKAQLAAAHGELLALRRQLPQAAISTDKQP